MCCIVSTMVNCKKIDIVNLMVTFITGSHYGGLTLTLDGSSLSTLVDIKIDGRPCTNLQGTSTRMTCVTPSSTSESEHYILCR